MTASHTSMMWFSHSTTSQRRSFRLRSGECGDHYSIESGRLWCLNNGHLVLRDLKCQEKISLMIMLIHSRLDPCFHIVYTKILTLLFKCCSRHWDSPQPRQRFSSFLEPLHTATSASCSQQTRVSPCVVFCFWTSSALRLKVVLLQSWSSVYFAYNECLFELLLPSLGSKQSAHSPMAPHLKKAFSLRDSPSQNILSFPDHFL